MRPKLKISFFSIRDYFMKISQLLTNEVWSQLNSIKKELDKCLIHKCLILQMLWGFSGMLFSNIFHKPRIKHQDSEMHFLFWLILYGTTLWKQTEERVTTDDPFCNEIHLFHCLVKGMFQFRCQFTTFRLPAKFPKNHPILLRFSQ